MTDLKLLDPRMVRFDRPSGGLRLTLERNQSFEDVTLVRAFPLSDPDRYWGVLDSDGKDLGVIAEPEQMDGNSLEVARHELERRYFIPTIQHVIKTGDDHGSTVWTVETDRGARTFVVRNMKDSIVELGGARLLLVDVDGNRYEIPDMNRLDPKSYDLILRSQ